MALMHRTAWLLTFPWLLGCATESSDPRPTAATEQLGSALAGGSPAPKETAVVSVKRILSLTDTGSASTYLCTGTLVTPNLVLTARHCIGGTPADGVPNAATYCQRTFPPAPATDVFVFTSATSGNVFAPEAKKVKTIYVQSTDATCDGYDVALLLLTANVPAAEATPLGVRLRSAPVLNETYRAIGFGETSYGANDQGTRQERTGLKVACVGTACSDIGYGNSLREWRGPEGGCRGDSGGPAIDASGEVFGVLAHASVSETTCVSPAYARLDVSASWLKAMASLAAQDAKNSGAPYALPAWSQDTPSGGGAGGATSSGQSGTTATTPSRPNGKPTLSGQAGGTAGTSGESSPVAAPAPTPNDEGGCHVGMPRQNESPLWVVTVVVSGLITRKRARLAGRRTHVSR